MAKAKSDTQVLLDLDAIKPEVKRAIKINGVIHEIKPITLGDYIENTKRVQELAAMEVHDPVKETEILIDMLLRAFPTVEREDLMKLPLETLTRLNELTVQITGEAQVTEEAKAEAKKGK